MSRPQVWTSTPDRDGTDRIYLETLGSISGLRYSSSFPGGSLGLSCTLAVDPLLSHRALTPGRDAGVTVGAEDVWSGTLNAPTVADDGRRSITADGDAGTPQHFIALGLATHNALNINEVIDAATLSGRHSRLRRPAALLPVADGLFAVDGAFTMDEALTQAASSVSKRWRIDPDRVIRFYPLEGDGSRLLLHARQDIGRTLDGFVTRLDAVYIDSLTGLRRVEHLDAAPADTGSTYYPAFYASGGAEYADGGFTLYADGTAITAYTAFAPGSATVLTLSSPAVDLTLVETSQFYSRWTGTGTLPVGATGRTGEYKAYGGGPVLHTSAQEGPVHRGRGSLDATGNIAPREAIIDLTSQGAFTRAEVLQQLGTYMQKAKTQPHYAGSWDATYGDLRNLGGVPVDLATVRAGVQITVLVVDPTRNLSLAGDSVLVTTGEVEYDVDSDRLRLTPVASTGLAEPTRYVDPATGLVR